MFYLVTSLLPYFQDIKEGEKTSGSTILLLVLSLLWSFKTSAVTSVKIKVETKTFLPFFPKLVLGIR
jgi:hypothetical protein